MGNFLDNNKNPLKDVQIKVAGNSHIFIRDKEKCLEICENKTCTYYCPTRVIAWSDEEIEIKINYRRCIECGSCPIGCPLKNIDWSYPTGGYGVKYEY